MTHPFAPSKREIAETLRNMSDYNMQATYLTMPNRFRVSASVSAINPSEMTAP